MRSNQINFWTIDNKDYQKHQGSPSILPVQTFLFGSYTLELLFTSKTLWHRHRNSHSRLGFLLHYRALKPLRINHNITTLYVNHISQSVIYDVLNAFHPPITLHNYEIISALWLHSCSPLTSLQEQTSQITEVFLRCGSTLTNIKTKRSILLKRELRGT